MINFYFVILTIGLFLVAVLIILWEIFSNRKSNNIKIKYTRICPKCKSKNVSPDFSPQTFGEQSEFNAYKCNECSYRGIFFPEIDKTIK